MTCRACERRILEFPVGMDAREIAKSSNARAGMPGRQDSEVSFFGSSACGQKWENEQRRILAQDVEEYFRPIYQSEAQFVVVLLGRDYPKANLDED